MTNVSCSLFLMTLKSNSSPITNMNRTNPIWLNKFKFISDSGGNSAAENSGKKYPSNEGPKTIPATISPITPGWPMYLKRNENIRTVIKITMICNNRIVSELVRLSEIIRLNSSNDPISGFAVLPTSEWSKCCPVQSAK